MLMSLAMYKFLEEAQYSSRTYTIATTKPKTPQALIVSTTTNAKNFSQKTPKMQP